MRRKRCLIQTIWDNGSVNSADEDCWFSCSKQLKLEHTAGSKHDLYIFFPFYCMGITIQITYMRYAERISCATRGRKHRPLELMSGQPAWCLSMGGIPVGPHQEQSVAFVTSH